MDDGAGTVDEQSVDNRRVHESDENNAVYSGSASELDTDFHSKPYASIDRNGDRIGKRSKTKSIRNSNDEVDPVVLAKCQMQCLSLFFFVPTLIFIGIGFISLMYSFHFTYSYSPTTGEIIDSYHCGCEGGSASTSFDDGPSHGGHKTFILQHSGSRYQYKRDRSSNATITGDAENYIKDESGRGSGRGSEPDTACTPIFGSIIEYSDYDGQRHSFPSDICTSSKPTTGKKVKVYFDPLDTSKGKDGSFHSLWYFPLQSIIFALVPAIFLMVLRRRKEDLLTKQITYIQQQQDRMRQKGEEQSLLSKEYRDIIFAQNCDNTASENSFMSTSNGGCVATLDIYDENGFADAEKCLELTSKG